MKVNRSDITLIEGMLFSILSQVASIYVFKLFFAIVAIVLIIISMIEENRKNK